MRIAILGAGRVGSHLANAIVDKNGDTIIVIDEKERKLKNIIEHPRIHQIQGNIFDEKVSDMAFAEEVDVFVVVTGNDNINIMAAQAMQKKYPIRDVLIRIFDSDLANVYRTLGFKIVCPTDYTLSEFMKMLGWK
jgi:trk system potassium uptake protein TrkA